MTPPTQQSDVDEAIKRLEAFNGFVKMGITHHVETDYCDDIESLITEIHRLRLEREIAVEASQIIKGFLVITKGRWRSLPLDTPEKKLIAKAEQYIEGVK